MNLIDGLRRFLNGGCIADIARDEFNIIGNLGEPAGAAA
jgi:hypothetical protein